MRRLSPSRNPGTWVARYIVEPAFCTGLMYGSPSRYQERKVIWQFPSSRSSRAMRKIIPPTRGELPELASPVASRTFVVMYRYFDVFEIWLKSNQRFLPSSKSCCGLKSHGVHESW